MISENVQRILDKIPGNYPASVVFSQKGESNHKSLKNVVPDSCWYNIQVVLPKGLIEIYERGSKIIVDLILSDANFKEALKKRISDINIPSIEIYE